MVILHRPQSSSVTSPPFNWRCYHAMGSLCYLIVNSESAKHGGSPFNDGTPVAFLSTSLGIIHHGMKCLTNFSNSLMNSGNYMNMIYRYPPSSECKMQPPSNKSWMIIWSSTVRITNRSISACFAHSCIMTPVTTRGMMHQYSLSWRSVLWSSPSAFPLSSKLLSNRSTPGASSYQLFCPLLTSCSKERSNFRLPELSSTTRSSVWQNSSKQCL